MTPALQNLAIISMGLGIVPLVWGVCGGLVLILDALDRRAQPQPQRSDDTARGVAERLGAAGAVFEHGERV